MSIWVGVFGILSSIAGIAGTVAAIRSSSARRYAERGRDAAALLEALDKAEESKFISEASNVRLRAELGRVIRESAAVYGQQFPTPAGSETLRMLSAAYAVTFLLFGLGLLVAAGLQSDASVSLASAIAGVGALVFAIMCAATSLTLLERVKRRNEARKLSDTPGRERYFETIYSLVDTVKHRRAFKASGDTGLLRDGRR